MKRAEIESLLPAVFRRAAQSDNDVMAALLDVMQALHERPEYILSHLDAWFDPGRTPDHFVPFLARWVDLDRFFTQSFKEASTPSVEQQPISSGLGRLRELIRQASYLSKWRGTRKGLAAFLETTIGVSGFDVDENVAGTDGRPKPFHVRVQVPASAEAHLALIERIIESEKPAHITYELTVMHHAEGE